ncbi:hypothetical protein ACKWTF_000134 [Chironomus riparius]
MNSVSIIAFILFMLLWTYVTCTIELTGDHVCHKQENYTEPINATTKEPMQVRVNFWCIEKIRCSEMQSDIKEVVRIENVTRSRVIKFCCPGYEEFEIDGKKNCKASENETTPIEPKRSTKNPKSDELDNNMDSSTKESKTTDSNETDSTTSSAASKNITLELTEKNPYMNYSGEYGKDFNHYMKMGLNESDPQQSVNKLMEMEIKKAKEDYDTPEEEDESYVFVDVAGNEIEPLKHPQYVMEHHYFASNHDENLAMVTVGCVIFGMCIFLMLMVYILRKQQQYDRDIEVIDPRFESKKTKMPPAKIIHDSLPRIPNRSSLKKQRSVTFDESIDEVDEFNRRRTKSLPDAYDVPRKQTSMMDLVAQTIPITPADFAIYAMSQKSIYNTFPRKNISRKQSLEHIYDEIPTIAEIKAADDASRSTMDIKSDESKSTADTEVTYANEIKKDENIEKTKM